MKEEGAIKQVIEASQLKDRAKQLLKSYLCSDFGFQLKYKDEITTLLAEHISNTNMYSNIMTNILLSDSKITDKKTGEQTIIVEQQNFELISAYLTIIAGCENELDKLGISMRVH